MAVVLYGVLYLYHIPKDKQDWFVGNNLNDKIYTGSLDEIKDKLDKDQNSSRYYRDSKLTPDGF